MSLFRILTYRIFTPTEISNLVIWLSVDNISSSLGNKISNWIDQSGNGYNFLQSVSTYQPTYNLNVVTGKNDLQFNLNHFLYNQTALSELKNVTNVTIICVINPTNGTNIYFSDGKTSYGARVQSSQSSSPKKLKLNAKRLDSENETSLSSTENYVNDGFYDIHLCDVDFQNGIVNQYINSRLDSTSALTTSGATSNTDSNAILIGAQLQTPALNQYPSSTTYPQTDSYAKTEIAEILVYKKKLTDLERFNITQYLRIKYNVQLSQLVPSSSLNPTNDLYLPW